MTPDDIPEAKAPPHPLECPVQSSGAQEAHDFAPESSATAESVRFRILILGGEGMFTDGVEKSLESAGHQVLTVGSAADALAQTTLFQPDMILLDQQVEGASGGRLLSLILTEQPSAGVIVVARSPKISEVVEAIRHGAADYLEGPVDALVLNQAIESLKNVI
jgi:DNA-binding NtrC family response regulator